MSTAPLTNAEWLLLAQLRQRWAEHQREPHARTEMGELACITCRVLMLRITQLERAHVMSQLP